MATKTIQCILIDSLYILYVFNYCKILNAFDCLYILILMYYLCQLFLELSYYLLVGIRLVAFHFRIYPIMLRFYLCYCCLRCYKRCSLHWGSIRKLDRKRVRLISLTYTLLCFLCLLLSSSF